MNRQPAPNPFVGLRPFERADSLYYFGRDTQVQSLLTSLHQSRFLAVVGSSGCGKSSLIRAGLIPALEAGFLVQDRDRWRIATCKPGEAPLGHLAAALREATGQAPDPAAVTRLADRLLEEGAEAALALLGPTLESDDTNLLLLVDQFEELFRFHQDPAGTGAATHRAEAEGFVDLLLRLATRDRLPVYCVITMRSDFIGDCDAFTGLPEAINRGQFLVPRLTRGQRREAIVGPVRLTGERIAPRLVDRLLNERLDTRDDLPILQHLLMRCWDAWSEQPVEQPAEQPAESPRGPHDRGPIDLEHYERVHTIHGALNAHAGEALEELGDEDQDLARRLFQALTETDPGNRRIRRPTRLSDLTAITGATEPRLRQIIDGFAKAPLPTGRGVGERGSKSERGSRGERGSISERGSKSEGGRNFLVLSGDPDPMVDISHESLIRQWKSLHNWVDQEAANADIYRRLAETAAKHNPAAPRFYRDAELQEAIAWRRRQQPTAAWAGRYRTGFQPALDFLWESRRTRIEEHRERRRARLEREQARAERERLLRERAEQDRRARHTARNWSLGLGILAVLMLLLAGYAFQLWNQAEQAEQASQQQLIKANINLARVHEEKAVAWLERATKTENTGHYRRALLQALQAQRQPTQGNFELQATSMARLTDPRIAEVFREQWRSPTARLGSTPNDIAWSPDGQWLASASDDNTLRLWDPATGQPIRTLSGHEGEVNAVVFSPDGQLLASASWDDTLRLWDPTTGALIRTLAGHEDRVTAVAFSPDGQLLASASYDHTLRLWDPTTGVPIRTLSGHEDWVNAVAFSPDGQLLASASENKTVRLWNLATGQSIRTLSGHEDDVHDLAFSPDGKWLASASGDKRVQLWNPATGEPIRTLSGHKYSVTAVAFSPDGQLLASASADGSLRLWNPATGQPIHTLSGHESWVTAVAFSPDGQQLASASEDKRVRLWNPATGAPIHTLAGHESSVTAVAFSPDGQLLASASYDETLRLWNPATGQPIRTLSGHKYSVTAVAFSPDGQLLASASQDNTLRLWDPATGQRIHTLTEHEGRVTAVAFSPDGQLLASASQDNTLRLWNPATGQPIRTLSGPEGEVTSVAFSPDGQLLASASADRTLRLWDPATGQPIRILSGHEHWVTAVAFSPDGQLLASASSDNTLRLWDPATGQPIYTLAGHKGDVNDLAFSPDGQLLASASRDNTLRLWDPATGQPIRTLSGHKYSVTAVAFSPDGQLLA
ncbi:MAG: hypothetical protein LGR52_16055, partial [Candidatus Thiosymbion ectosymbiont of Robbea hypermnestra]|nr:hypothetical protein [Candidatus Thiosymbion ectosymbiont of Robbea hypermnestra]